MYYAYSRLSRRKDCGTINDTPFTTQGLLNGGDTRGFAASIFFMPSLSQSSENEDNVDQPSVEAINDAVVTVSLSVSDESVLITLNQVSDVLELDVSDMTNATKSIIRTRLNLRVKQPSTNEIKKAVDECHAKENTRNLTELEVFDYITHKLALDAELTIFTQNIICDRIKAWCTSTLPSMIIRDVATTRILRTYPSFRRCNEEEGLGLRTHMYKNNNRHGYAYTKSERRYFLQRKDQRRLTSEHMNAIFDESDRLIEKLRVTSHGVTVINTYNDVDVCFSQNQNAQYALCTKQKFRHGE